MSWLLYRWVWIVQAPLHIGISPAGMLNRTRLYVPARTLWGALTAQKAQAQANSTCSFPDYKKEGKEIRQNFRFGYLFPAEWVGGQWKAWLPRYTENGLVWQREGDGETLEDRKFRMRLLGTRPGTAIDPETDTALEGALREFEVINPFWQSEKGPHSVALVGYVFARSKPKEVPSELFCGGDTRYGLGRIRLAGCTVSSQFFDWQVETNQENPVLFHNSSQDGGARVLAHIEAASTELRGDYEVLGGWDYGNLQEPGKLFWKPGCISNRALRCEILEDGYWKGTGDERTEKQLDDFRPSRKCAG